ncbi:MAG: hypothetical protein QXU79_02900 [Candidatus Micrarchaeaceae archaeon]
MEQAKPNPDEFFLTLRAEEEGDWLAECFVAPEDFERILGERSIVVFGRPGSGKSALCRMMECKAYEGRRLPVRWSPLEAAFLAAEETTLPGLLSDVFDACGIALLEHLARFPSLDDVPAWAMQMLRWFIHRFIRGHLYARAGHLLTPECRLPQPFTVLLAPPKKDLLPADDYPLILAELSRALRAAGLVGIWILVDIGGIGGEAASGLVASLSRLLSALPLFERGGFSWKLFLPSRLEAQLVEVSGLERRRLDCFRLEWDFPTLRQIVERRLALATGDSSLCLGDLCSSPDWLLWLRRVGGDIPREWLEQVRPVLERYLSDRRPVDEATWRALRRKYPPRLYLDEAGGVLRVGGWEIPFSKLSGHSLNLLRYLYAHANRTVSRPELYFRACKGMPTIPRVPDDEGYEAPAIYRGLLDTALWRLRQAIEPDPEDPILLRTVRGEGVRLEVCW